MGDIKVNKRPTVKALLSDKRGFTLPQWCCLIVALLLIICFVMTYLMAITTISYQEQQTKHTLDRYVDENSIRIYQEVKEHSDKTDEILTEEFTTMLMDICKLTYTEDGRLTALTKDGKTRYAIYDLRVAFEEDYTAKLVVTYKITTAVRFGGKAITWVEVPMTVISRFNPKFSED